MSDPILDPPASDYPAVEPDSPAPLSGSALFEPSNGQEGAKAAFDAAVDPAFVVEAQESPGARAIRERIEAARVARVAALRDNAWTLSLPTGRSVTFRDPADLTEGQRRRWKQAGVESKLLFDRVAAGGDPGNAARTAVSSDYILVAMFVREWSYDLPLPKVGDVRSIDDVVGRDLDAIIWACKDLMPEAFLTVKPTLEPDSPFGATSG